MAGKTPSAEKQQLLLGIKAANALSLGEILEYLAQDNKIANGIKQGPANKLGYTAYLLAIDQTFAYLDRYPKFINLNTGKRYTALDPKLAKDFRCVLLSGMSGTRQAEDLTYFQGLFGYKAGTTQGFCGTNLKFSEACDMLANWDKRAADILRSSGEKYQAINQAELNEKANWSQLAQKTATTAGEMVAGAGKEVAFFAWNLIPTEVKVVAAIAAGAYVYTIWGARKTIISTVRERVTSATMKKLGKE